MSRFIVPGLIIGSQVHIAKFGTAIGSGDQAKKVSADWLPVPPTTEDPGPWLYMGKIRTSNPQTEPKTAEIEGTSVGGTYDTEELQLVTKRKFLFASNYITPEFLQLSFGLREGWGTEQVVFASGSTQIDVYVYTEWTDAYRDGARIMSACMQGRLRLVNPAKAASDPALAEFELSVAYNPLCKLTPDADYPAL
jgi:hypothetical protein